MSRRAHGQFRQSQVITTYGPGALIDLPRHSAIVGGLDTWPNPGELDEVVEPRLTSKLQAMTGVPMPRLYAPPPRPNEPWAPARGIGAWRFPEWFVVQEAAGGGERGRSRRLVHRKALDEKGRFEGRPVVPTRFVRACPRGHVDDLDWAGFVHDAGDDCRRQLWLDERGTTGDLADLVVRCECGKWRRLYEAAERDQKPLGACRGARPWLGRGTNEECGRRAACSSEPHRTPTSRSSSACCRCRTREPRSMAWSASCGTTSGSWRTPPTSPSSRERRWLHGAACHGCALIAETSCEMRNDYLDRALVVPVLGLEDAAFFQAPG